MAADVSNKRKRPDNDEPDSDSENRDNWPRFLVMQDGEDSDALARLSPFALAKGIKGLAGDPKSVKKIKQGYLLEVCLKSHCDLLLRSTTLANVPIKVSAHRTLNSSKGVIYCSGLTELEEESIAAELAKQLVTDVQRIKTDRGTKKTNLYILTFSTPRLPEEIKVGHLNVKVKMYIPNPLRCYKCQEYGHGANRCTKKERCFRCGEHHQSTVCTADQPSCFHCSGKHTTADRNCPTYKVQKEIVALKHKENITFFEAKKRVVATAANPVSYAEVLQRKVSVETQTNLTWTHDGGSPTPWEPSPPASQSSGSQTEPTTSNSAPDRPISKDSTNEKNSNRRSRSKNKGKGKKNRQTDEEGQEVNPPDSKRPDQRLDRSQFDTPAVEGMEISPPHLSPTDDKQGQNNGPPEEGKDLPPPNSGQAKNNKGQSNRSLSRSRTVVHGSTPNYPNR